MRFHIENGSYLGTVEWHGPGHVELDMADETMRSWFHDYFSSEDPALAGTIDCPTYSAEPRDASAGAFARAIAELGTLDYSVRPAFPERAMQGADR